jgi:hypothetical protein
MKIILSAVLGLLLMQVSAEANSVTRSQFKKVRSLENKLDSLYERLESKTQEILPPLKKLKVSEMNIDELVEVQKILAPFYAIDNKLSAYPKKLRVSQAQKNLAQFEQELVQLENIIKDL